MLRYWAVGVFFFGALAALAQSARAVTVDFDFSGFKVIEAFEGTEGGVTATLAGTVSLGDPVWGRISYDSDAGRILGLYINVNDVIVYSGPPAGANTNVWVANDIPHDAFEAVTTHPSPLDELTLPSGVTNNLDYLQAGISLFDTDGALYSDTTLPTSLSLGDFDWGRVHLWTWFPDLDGGGIANTAWRIMADYRPAPVPEPSTLLLLGSGLAGVGGFAWRRHRRG